MAKQKLPKEILEFFRKQGRKGGKIGGKKRMDALSPLEKKAFAQKGVMAREAKRKTKGSLSSTS